MRAERFLPPLSCLQIKIFKFKFTSSVRCYSFNFGMSQKSSLTAEEREKIEKNRQHALSIRMKKTSKLNSVPVVQTLKKNVLNIDGNTFIDSTGGFLIEETPKKQDNSKPVNDVFELGDFDLFICKECGKEFIESYLQKHFNYNVCDACQDNEDKHSLITRSDLKKEYLLKDCDIDLREPPLKFISRKNPHNSRWGEMKLYLLPQVTERAIEVWGSLEKLEEEHVNRSDKRVDKKAKKYNKNLKALRMATRSSLFDRTKGATHQHDFGPETYNEEEDNYSKACKTCPFIEVYEKM